jgi:peptidoglycan/xylan/chitin deacetylase (PgdA/CDA1 family)
VTRFLRRALLPAAWLNGRVRAQRWRGVRFLCYHSITESATSSLDALTLVVSRDGFARHLEMIRTAGYVVVSMIDALSLVESGRAAEGQFICFTFDDGRIDNFEVAWPLLRARGFSAHFFVNSGRLGQTIEQATMHGRIADCFMDAAMLRSIVNDGGSIGSHGLGHEDLTTLSDAALNRELVESRQVLEDAIEEPVTTHAYPFARYDARVVQAAGAAGYTHAFGIRTGTTAGLAATPDARLTIARNVIRSGADAAENYAIMRGGFDFTRHYSNVKTWLNRS